MLLRRQTLTLTHTLIQSHTFTRTHTHVWEDKKDSKRCHVGCFWIFWLFRFGCFSAVSTVFEDFDCQFAIVSKLKQQQQQQQQEEQQQQKQQQPTISWSGCGFCQLPCLFLSRFYFAIERLLCGFVIAAKGARSKNAQL